LIIANTFIGKPSEECYLPTWISSLTCTKNRIANTKQSLFPKEFAGLSDREIFDLILKSNQEKKEFYPAFLYLPQTHHNLWDNHHFTLDETIDDYVICFYVKDNQITFLIEDASDDFESSYRPHEFIFSSLPVDLFFQTIDETVAILIQAYPHLAKYVSKRTLNK